MISTTPIVNRCTTVKSIMRDGQLVTAGMIGYIMVVTGVADTIDAARDAAYAACGKSSSPTRATATTLAFA